MGRPLNAEVPEIVETCLDGAVAPAEGREELLLEAGDGGEVHESPGAAGQHRKPLLRCRECACEELALGAVELELEGECGASTPAVFRKQRSTGSEIGQSRGVGGSILSALACH